jgi:hypothetical protein
MSLLIKYSFLQFPVSAISYFGHHRKGKIQLLIDYLLHADMYMPALFTLLPFNIYEPDSPISRFPKFPVFPYCQNKDRRLFYKQ